MLANESALVLSVDIASTQIFHPYPCSPTTTDHPAATIIAMSDVVISAVPGGKYRVPTSGLKPGAVCINIAMDTKFEADVRDKAGLYAGRVGAVTILMLQLNCFFCGDRAPTYCSHADMHYTLVSGINLRSQLSRSIGAHQDGNQKSQSCRKS